MHLLAIVKLTKLKNNLLELIDIKKRDNKLLNHILDNDVEDDDKENFKKSNKYLPT